MSQNKPRHQKRIDRDAGCNYYSIISYKLVSGLALVEDHHEHQRLTTVREHAPRPTTIVHK